MNKKKFKNRFNHHRKSYNFISSTFYALDDVLEGNKLYDWYYDNVWCRIWRLFKHYPKEFKLLIKRYTQRGKTCVSMQDCWSVSDWLYESFAEACRKFILEEYGKTEPNWKEWVCQTHDKKLYKKLTKYIKTVENYKKHLSEEDFEDYDLLDKEREDIHKQILSIIKDDVENMWS